MAAKPIVLPDNFTGEASWDDWMCHFENVTDVNGWDDDQKLKFLKVRLTGRAQKAFQHRNEDIQTNYSELLSQGTFVASAGPEDLSREKQKLLWDLVEENGAHLLDCQKDKFYNLFSNYSCIFATSDHDLGWTSDLRHCIETGNAAPVRQAVRRLPPARRKEVQDFRKKMQEKDVI